MARYYFDVQDGDDFARDELGVECSDLHEAMAEAKQSLADISSAAMTSKADAGLLAIVVRKGQTEVGSISMSYKLQMVPLRL